MLSKLSPRTRRTAAEIGTEIRAARLAAEISQEKLAEKIGMTRGNYARIEQGRTNVTLDTLLRIADGLGLSLHVALTEREKPGGRRRRPR